MKILIMTVTDPNTGLATPVEPIIALAVFRADSDADGARNQINDAMGAQEAVGGAGGNEGRALAFQTVFVTSPDVAVGDTLAAVANVYAKV